MRARSITMLLLLPIASPWALAEEKTADPREEGVSSWEAPSYEQAAWMRDHATAYTWGARGGYSHHELATILERMGARVARLCLPGYMRPGMKAYHPGFYTWIDHLRRPEFQTFMDRFDTIVFTVADGSQQKDDALTRKRFGALARYLLSEYASVRKTFLLGTWEGDNAYREASMAGKPERVRQLVNYFNARHDGVVEARHQAPHSKSRVYDMTEVNRIDYEGEKFLINRVVPQTYCDVYSVSSYTCQREMTRGLTYIKSKCPDSAPFGSDNVMVGEFGITARERWQDRLGFVREKLAEVRAMNAVLCVKWELAGALRGAWSCPRGRAV